MSATDHDIIQKVQQWIAYGDEDLQLAKHALTLTRTTPYRLIAYHAQQCAGNGVRSLLLTYSFSWELKGDRPI